MANSGDRPQQLIAYDEVFKMMTLPTTARKKAQIIPRYGVKIHGIYYWSDHFRRPSCHRKKVPVRYEPFDIGTAYALLDGQWIPLMSEEYAAFRGMSEKMLMLLMTMRQQLAKQHGRMADTVSARKLAEFARLHQKDAAVLKLRKREIESAAALRLVDGTTAPAAAAATTTLGVSGNAMPEAKAASLSVVRSAPDDVPQEAFTTEIEEDDYEDFAS
jgi:hypothetical protein